MLNQFNTNEYAKAIFEIAQQENNLKDFCQDLLETVWAFRQSGEFKTLYDSHYLNKNDRKQLLDEVFGNDINVNILNTLKVLIDDNKSHAVVNILNKAIDLCNHALNYIYVIIKSAFELSTIQIEQITNKIASKTQQTPIIKLIVDPELIGGLKIKYGSQLLDNSVTGKLNQIRTKIQKENL